MIKKRSLALAALAPLVAISAGNAVADEMAPPEMRVWSATLSEASEEAAGMALEVTASAAAGGSNRMAIVDVAIVVTEISKDEEGNMTTAMSSVACAGPGMVEGGAFMIEAAPPMEEEEGETAQAEEAEETGCSFAVSGEVKHTYRAWHSWDMAGSVTMGEMSMDFDIASAAPAMIREPEPEMEESEGTGEES